MRQDIEFVSAGTTLRGWLYTPDGTSGPHPAVVVTHGLGAVKEQYTDDIAEALAAAGLAVVLYDHASFGASDGEPRQEVDPWKQIQGYRDAVTFLCTRPEVDAERIGVFGSSFSGGHVLVVGAIDRRVKAVYSQVPVISGGTTLSRFIPSEALAEVRKSFDADRLARFNGEAPAMIPLVTATPGEPAAMADRETYEWYQTIEPERLATWRNEVTLRSVEAIAGYEPGDYVARISPTPLMLVVAQHDVLTHSDLAFAAYERALHPKQLVTLPGGHFVVYDQEFKNTLALMTEFFLRHLAPPDGRLIDHPGVPGAVAGACGVRVSSCWGR